MKRIIEESILGNSWVANDGYDLLNIEEKDLIKNILKNRGLEEKEYEDFLNPSIRKYMPDPLILKDMDKAVRIIADAIIKNKKICIYGDYDVDGITSTAIFVKYLMSLDVDLDWYIPERENDGYGLSIPAIKKLVDKNVELIITVDCGITGIEEVEYGKSIGLDIVITDHHNPDSFIPKADAIVNPKRSDDNSGLDYLAGVGVAFLTLTALNRYLRDNFPEFSEKIKNINLLNYLDFVALGTVCDTMPLVRLNRAFVSTGLKVINLRQNLGLSILMDLISIKTPNSYSLGFGIGPRLNAAGRLESAIPALELLLSDDEIIANDLAIKLNDLNQERVGIQNNILIQAQDKAENIKERYKYSLFISGDNWHGGVMGIIAGRLKDKYSMPVCVGTCKDGVINGSGRSIFGVDLGKIIYDALSVGILTDGGGHSMAAGFSLKESNKDRFQEFLENATKEQLNGKIPINEIFVDGQINACAVNSNLLESLSSLEPFGSANNEPVFVLSGLSVGSVYKIGDGKHLKGCFNTDRGSLNFVGFNLVDTKLGKFLLDSINRNTKIKALGKVKENNLNNTVQFVLEDLVLG